MVVEIKITIQHTKIAENLDTQISQTKSLLGEQLRKLDEIRILAEKSKKVREIVMKLAGKKGNGDGVGEITVGSLTIVLDSTPFHELTAIESVVRSHQERLLTLQKAREAFKMAGSTWRH